MHKKQGEMLSQVAYLGLVTASLLAPLLRSGKREKVRLMRTAETLGLCTLVVHSLKYGVDAKRPDSLEQNSFPSSHTMNSLAVATVASAYARKEASAWYGGAVLVGLSRLLLRRHYLRDVVAGACFGSLLARLELSRRRGFLLPSLSKRFHDWLRRQATNTASHSGSMGEH